MHKLNSSLFLFLSHQWDRVKGTTAIERSIIRNGATLHNGNAKSTFLSAGIDIRCEVRSPKVAVSRGRFQVSAGVSPRAREYALDPGVSAMSKLAKGAHTLVRGRHFQSGVKGSDIPGGSNAHSCRKSELCDDENRLPTLRLEILDEAFP